MLKMSFGLGKPGGSSSWKLCMSVLPLLIYSLSWNSIYFLKRPGLGFLMLKSIVCIRFHYHYSETSGNLLLEGWEDHTVICGCPDIGVVITGTAALTGRATQTLWVLRAPWQAPWKMWETPQLEHRVTARCSSQEGRNWLAGLSFQSHSLIGLCCSSLSSCCIPLQTNSQVQRSFKPCLWVKAVLFKNIHFGISIQAPWKATQTTNSQERHADTSDFPESMCGQDPFKEITREFPESQWLTLYFKSGASGLVSLELRPVLLQDVTKKNLI